MNKKQLLKSLVLIFLIVISNCTSSWTLSPQLCATNSGTSPKQNQLDVAVPDQNPPTDFQFQNKIYYQKGGLNQITTLVARKDQANANKFIMEAILTGLSTVTQYDSSFTNGFTIIGLKGPVALVQDLSNNAYKLYSFDQGFARSNNNAVFPVTSKKTLGTPVIDYSNTAISGSYTIKMLLNYQTNLNKQLSMVVRDSSGKDFVNIVSLDDGVMHFKGKLSSATTQNIYGGDYLRVWNDIEKNMYIVNKANPQNYAKTDQTALLGTGNTFQKNIQILNLEGTNTVYFSHSDDLKSAKFAIFDTATLPLQLTTVTATGIYTVGFYSDYYNNFITFSDKIFFWYQFDSANPTTTYLPIKYTISNPGTGTPPSATDLQILNDFKDSKAVDTNNNKGFVLGASSMKYFKIYKGGGSDKVDKIQQITIDSAKVTEIMQVANTVYALKLKCLCIVNLRPKLICFQKNLDCLAISRKKIQVCTTPEALPT